MSALHEALRSLAVLVPGATVEAIEPLADTPGSTSEKALGYGEPLKVVLREPGGGRRTLVFRRPLPNEFGHDRRADRLESAVLAFDTFGDLPRQVRTVDVGTMGPDGRLHSLREAGEPYLVTEWAEGSLYVEDLRRIAAGGEVTPQDVARADALARHLATLHQGKLDDRVAWRRAVRDLLGHGEGLFGVVDAWPDGEVPSVPPERLRSIEERCLAWRWRLRGRERRLSRTHGDFHPFNVVFLPGRPGEDHVHLATLDASRGCRGDPADDVTALSVNYPFLALAAGGEAWKGLGALWHRFWDRYLALTGDREVLEVAPPFWAWRCLVVASPRFYPRMTETARSTLVGMAEAALEAGRLELDLPDRVLLPAGGR